MIRVGHVIGQLNWGGAERQLFELASRTRQEGIESKVFCLSESTDPYASRLRDADVEVEVFRRRCSFDLLRIRNLRSSLLDSGLDVVHSWLLDDNNAAALALLGTGLPWIASVRSRPMDRDHFHRFLDRWSLTRADWVVVNESRVAGYIKDHIGAEVRGLTVLPNGVDMDRLKPRLSRRATRSLFSTPPEAGVVLFAGRLEEVKNLHFVLRIISNILKTVRPAPVLWLAGEGSQRESLKQSAVTLGIDGQVRFLGAREDLPDIYSAADVFIFPSLSEGLPNVVLEAMGCGLAVVVSETAGCQDFVRHEENGIILSGFDSSAYEEAVRTLLENPEHRKKLGFQATSTIKELFAVDSMTRQACDLYRKVSQNAIGS